MIIYAARPVMKEKPDEDIFKQVIGKDVWIKVRPKHSPSDTLYAKILRIDNNGWFETKAIDIDRLNFLRNNREKIPTRGYGRHFLIVCRPVEIITEDELFETEQ